MKNIFCTFIMTLMVTACATPITNEGFGDILTPVLETHMQGHDYFVECPRGDNNKRLANIQICMARWINPNTSKEVPIDPYFNILTEHGWNKTLDKQMSKWNTDFPFVPENKTATYFKKETRDNCELAVAVYVDNAVPTKSNTADLHYTIIFLSNGLSCIIVT